MKPSTAPSTRRSAVSIALLSASLIAFQIVLMQILSFRQWYHFAYMVISIALLGFGTSGTVLTLFRKWILERSDRILALLMFFCGGAMVLSFYLTSTIAAGFDIYLLFDDPSSVLLLVITCLLFFVPFLFGSLAIGIVFVRDVDSIGTLYFANLAGSGSGGILALLLASVIPLNVQPAAWGIVACIAGATTIHRDSFAQQITTAAGTVCLLLVFVVFPPDLVTSQFKDISKALHLPDSKILHEESGPYGVLQVVQAEGMRYAPGISLEYEGEIPTSIFVFNDGSTLGPLMSQRKYSPSRLFDYTTMALPYALGSRQRVLILDAGTGPAVLQAISNRAEAVTALVPNPALFDLLKNRYASATDSLFYHSRCRFLQEQPRTFLKRGSGEYELIIHPTVGAFGGTAGVYALKEEYTLTCEAFTDTWRRLSDNGLFAVTLWMDYPWRGPYKMLATIVETLSMEGIQEPIRHIAAVRGWGTITFIVSRSALSIADVLKIRNFSDRLGFDPALLPGITGGERARYNVLEDSLFFGQLDTIMSGDREDFLERYPFNIYPAKDDRPFFSQFLRWNTIPHLAELFGVGTLPYFELGYLIVFVTFVQGFVTAIILIVLPLFRLVGIAGFRKRTFLYFTALGLGYMFVEIVLIQKCILFLGHPLYSASILIGSLLLWSGAGSYFSSRIKALPGRLRWIIGALILMLLLYIFALDPVLEILIPLSFSLRMFFAMILTAPLAVLMGFPFPLGLRLLAVKSEALLPWAWGVNGFMSVISTSIATIIAVETGFMSVLLLAVFLYSLAFVSWSGRTEHHHS